MSPDQDGVLVYKSYGGNSHKNIIISDNIEVTKDGEYNTIFCL